MSLDQNGNDHNKEIQKLGVEVENENERCSVCRDLYLANYERRTKHQKEESKNREKSLDRAYDQCTKSWKDVWTQVTKQQVKKKRQLSIMRRNRNLVMT